MLGPFPVCLSFKALCEPTKLQLTENQRKFLAEWGSSLKSKVQIHLWISADASACNLRGRHQKSWIGKSNTTQRRCTGHLRTWIGKHNSNNYLSTSCFEYIILIIFLSRCKFYPILQFPTIFRAKKEVLGFRLMDGNMPWWGSWVWIPWVVSGQCCLTWGPEFVHGIFITSPLASTW